VSEEKISFCSPFFLIFYWLFENFFILGKKAQNFSLKNEINFKKKQNTT